MVLDPAGFWEARASCLVKGCGCRRGAARTSFSYFKGLPIFKSPPLLASRVEGSCIGEEVTAGAQSPLEFSASGRRRAATLLLTLTPLNLKGCWSHT